jgi:DNA-binding response OmpR family regulator
MDGIDATLRIRSNPKTRSIPILAATAKVMPGDRSKCLSAGLDDFLEKPFGHLELGDAIEKLLNKYSSQTDLEHFQETVNPRSSPLSDRIHLRTSEESSGAAAFARSWSVGADARRQRQQVKGKETMRLLRFSRSQKAGIPDAPRPTHLPVNDGSCLNLCRD